MAYSIARFSFAGMEFDGVVNLETGETFLSMTSTAGAVGRPASSTSEQGRTTYTLVPTAVAAAYFTHWAREGSKDAIATVQAIIQADMDRSIKEANGVTVAAVEHEANRVAIHHHLVQAGVDIGSPSITTWYRRRSDGSVTADTD